MTAEQVLERFRNSNQVREISTNIASGKATTQLKGLTGSAGSFIASALYSLHRSHILMILDDREEAAYFLNDIENLNGKEHVLFFPQSYRKPYHVEDTDNANILSRAETLDLLNRSSKPFLIITYPEALGEKVIAKKTLTKKTLELNRGEKVDPEFVIDVLNDLDFERIDFVLSPGQYSVRGGIIDVFSYASELPFRIEFFGKEVDSLRTFDIVDQLSVSQHEKITILPNIVDRQVSESRVSMLEFLPDTTLVWIKTPDLFGEKVDKEFESAEKIFNSETTIMHRSSPEELFMRSEDYKNQLSEFSFLYQAPNQWRKAASVVQFNQSPQPVFKKNFDLLIAELRSNVSKGISSLLFTDTAKQAERIYTIIEDISPDLFKDKPDAFTSIMLSIHEGFVDKDLSIACYTDHQIFERYHRFRLKSSFNKKREAITLKELQGLNPGDYVVHIDHGIGRFGGLEKIDVNGKIQEAIRIVYKDNDILYVSIHSLHRISKFSGQEGHVPKISKLGTNAWSSLKQKTKNKVKELAFDLISLYAKRKSQKGFEYSPDSYLQNELEASFIYEDTPDQEKSTAAVKKDMEAPFPMDRLICGDVGFGKTEIAIRAAFKAVTDGKQVAVLVPTTILALQHFKTFSDRLADLPCKVDYINRFKTTKQQKETLQGVVEGKIDILIGTHRIVGKDVKFKDLGLLIIDEEQKFGVSVKEKLKTIRTNVDTLTLTATPIPRTLQFSMMGARDLSVITTPPPNRYPIQTELHTFNEEIIRDAVAYEIARGGQVFFIHNKVGNIKEMAGMIQRLCPDARVITGHGQMSGEELEEVMMKFINGEYDVLVATTIIESGLDIPNANTIIINSAHMFGLSDLHQMRGRVGRTNKKAFCYLLTPPLSVLTSEARKRLKAIEEFSDLGSGFNIALRDLDIRGAGNILGAEQSGFISEIGFEMYMKVLDEAIEELKESDFKEIFKDRQSDTLELRKRPRAKTFVKDTQIDSDLEILIPDEYVSNITERLSLYKQLDDSSEEEDLQKFLTTVRDRFGNPPASVEELVETVRLRWIAGRAGIEKLVLKSRKMVAYFISNQQSPFYQSETFTRILSFVQSHPHLCRMKESNNKLMITFENISSVSEAVAVLRQILPAQDDE